MMPSYNEVTDQQAEDPKQVVGNCFKLLAEYLEGKYDVLSCLDTATKQLCLDDFAQVVVDTLHESTSRYFLRSVAHAKPSPSVKPDVYDIQQGNVDKSDFPALQPTQNQLVAKRRIRTTQIASIGAVGRLPEGEVVVEPVQQAWPKLTSSAPATAASPTREAWGRSTNLLDTSDLSDPLNRAMGCRKPMTTGSGAKHDAGASRLLGSVDQKSNSKRPLNTWKSFTDDQIVNSVPRKINTVQSSLTPTMAVQSKSTMTMQSKSTPTMTIHPETSRADENNTKLAKPHTVTETVEISSAPSNNLIESDVRFAALYTAMIESNIIPCLLSALHQVIRLLGAVEPSSNSDKECEGFASTQPSLSTPLLRTATVCRKFACEVLQRLGHVLVTLGPRVCELLLKTESVQTFAPDLEEILKSGIQRTKEQEKRTNITDRMGNSGMNKSIAAFAMPFSKVTDSRLHFKAPQHVILYQNREQVRDLFLNALREYREQSLSLRPETGVEFGSDSSVSHISTAHVRCFDALMPNNIGWFVRLFLFQLVHVCTMSPGEQDAGVLKLSKDQDKINKLRKRMLKAPESAILSSSLTRQQHSNRIDGAAHHRNSHHKKRNQQDNGFRHNERQYKTKSNINNSLPNRSSKVHGDVKRSFGQSSTPKKSMYNFPSIASLFSTEERFFYTFIVENDRFGFNSLLFALLITETLRLSGDSGELHQKTQTDGKTPKRKLSSLSDEWSLTEKVIVLKLLGKFVGALSFSPSWVFGTGNEALRAELEDFAVVCERSSYPWINFQEILSSMVDQLQVVHPSEQLPAKTLEYVLLRISWLVSALYMTAVDLVFKESSRYLNTMDRLRTIHHMLAVRVTKPAHNGDRSVDGQSSIISYMVLEIEQLFLYLDESLSLSQPTPAPSAAARALQASSSDTKTAATTSDVAKTLPKKLLSISGELQERSHAVEYIRMGLVKLISDETARVSLLQQGKYAKTSVGPAQSSYPVPVNASRELKTGSLNRTPSRKIRPVAQKTRKLETHPHVTELSLKLDSKMSNEYELARSFFLQWPGIRRIVEFSAETLAAQFLEDEYSPTDSPLQLRQRVEMFKRSNLTVMIRAALSRKTNTGVLQSTLHVAGRVFEDNLLNLVTTKLAESRNSEETTRVLGNVATTKPAASQLQNPPGTNKLRGTNNSNVVNGAESIDIAIEGQEELRENLSFVHSVTPVKNNVSNTLVPPIQEKEGEFTTPTNIQIHSTLVQYDTKTTISTKKSLREAFDAIEVTEVQSFDTDSKFCSMVDSDWVEGLRNVIPEEMKLMMDRPLIANPHIKADLYDLDQRVMKQFSILVSVLLTEKRELLSCQTSSTFAEYVIGMTKLAPYLSVSNMDAERKALYRKCVMCLSLMSLLIAKMQHDTPSWYVLDLECCKQLTSQVDLLVNKARSYEVEVFTTIGYHIWLCCVWDGTFSSSDSICPTNSMMQPDPQERLSQMLGQINLVTKWRETNLKKLKEGIARATKDAAGVYLSLCSSLTSHLRSQSFAGEEKLEYFMANAIGPHTILGALHVNI